MSVVFTHHALQRLEEMELTEEQVFEALRDWDADYPSPPNRTKGDSRTRVGRNGVVLAYSVKPDSSTNPIGEKTVVITVMWRVAFEREAAGQ